jgi:NADH dehydrogenase
MQTIIIVGGGAGGLELAKRLGDACRHNTRARVILVDRYPTHFWKPLLHKAASGMRDPQVDQIDYSAMAAEHGFEFVLGEVTAVDRERQAIEIAPSMHDVDFTSTTCRTLRFDKLVLALGSVTNFFDVPGAQENFFTLDNVYQAEIFRKRFMSTCMQAGEFKRQGDLRRAQIHIVIVGGGATGVELAAELRHSAYALRRYNIHALDPKSDLYIRLLERGERLLPHLHPRLSALTARRLQSQDVEVCTNTQVARVSDGVVYDAHQRAYRADLGLWAAGVKAPAICASIGVPVNHLNQVVVSASLQSIGDPCIYAIGDCAGLVCPAKGVIPPRAQVAHQQAIYLAKALLRDKAQEHFAFRYRDFGSLVSLGPFMAIGELARGAKGSSVKLEGFFARLLYNLMYQKHLLALRGFTKMIAHTAAEWVRAKVSPPVKLH